MRETLKSHNNYLQSITATCTGGTVVWNAAKELSEIMRHAQISEGFVVHNGKRYIVDLTHTFDFREVEER